MTISNVEMHNLVSRQLENSHIIISPGNEWFKQCVDFFISANTNVIIKIYLWLNDRKHSRLIFSVWYKRIVFYSYRTT